MEYVWIRYAVFAKQRLDENPTAARALLQQQGIRANEESKHLWLEVCKAAIIRLEVPEHWLMSLS